MNKSNWLSSWGPVRKGDKEKAAQFKQRRNCNPTANPTAAEFSAIMRLQSAKMDNEVAA